jgi:hypothetical protein
MTMRKGHEKLTVFLVELGVFFLEFFNPASGINQFLLTGKKGMAGRTYFHLHLLVDRTQFNCIATGAFRRDFMVFWMYIRFHINTSMEYDLRLLQFNKN